MVLFILGLNQPDKLKAVQMLENDFNKIIPDSLCQITMESQELCNSDKNVVYPYTKITAEEVIFFLEELWKRYKMQNLYVASLCHFSQDLYYLIR